MFKQRLSNPARGSAMRRFLAIAAAALVVAAGEAATAAADPVQPPKTFQFALTCTGIGDVLATNIGPSQTAAFQVVGTNAVILPGLTGQFGIVSAPGIVTRALAAGTTCTLTAAGLPGSLEPVEPPVTFPVVIVNG
jgi:xanthine/CO dehydrogenase XdhC/CoxF family maturation factor